MFCPKCGKSDQTPETYCRQCGVYLHDYEKSVKKEISPETHLKANAVLSLMSGIVSITLAVLLFVFFIDRPTTPPLIYLTMGFLTAMFFWQAQSFWRTILLGKHFKKKPEQNDLTRKQPPEALSFEAKPTSELLPEANFDNYVPISVTENTTTNIKDKIKR